MIKMSSSLICGVCDKESPDTFDGLCSVCESLWNKHLARLSKEVSPETSLRDLFAMATAAAIKEYEEKKSTTS